MNMPVRLGKSARIKGHALLCSKMTPGKGKRIDRQPNDLEIEFLQQIKLAGLPEPIREHRFSERRWRFDFAYPDRKIAVEVHGATWANGRHNRGKGFASDREKMNTAQMLGWLVIEVTADHVKSGLALQWLEEILSVNLVRHSGVFAACL